jgi:ferritin-like metal-binding protein YciE
MEARTVVRSSPPEDLMDRTPYDPPTRAGSTPQHGIAPATLDSEVAQRQSRSPEGRQTSALQDRTSEREQDYRQERGRLGSLQEQLSDLLSVRSFDELQDRVRANPFGAVALAAGIGFALQRTHVLDRIVGGILSDDIPEELTAEEERLLAWLNDAYALEKAQIPILENHAEDAHDQPHVRDRDLEHVERTKLHVKMVRKCIKLLGRKPSKAKDAIGRLGGAVNSLSTEPFDDEVVRNFVADFASENLEVASYQAIITAARDAGHEKIARICEEILDDEEEMADWLRSSLPRAVRDTLDALHSRDVTSPAGTQRKRTSSA